MKRRMRSIWNWNAKVWLIFEGSWDWNYYNRCLPGRSIRANELLISTSVSIPGYSSIMLQEITIAAWYIRWLRIPSMIRCAMSIRAIDADSANSTKLCISRWSTGRPTAKHLKLSVDAAFNIFDLTGATGSIISDNLGNFVAILCKYITHVPSASMEEAYAMQAGLQLAIQTGCNQLEAKSDCIEVIQYCSKEN